MERTTETSTTAALASRKFLTVEGYRVSYLEWGEPGRQPVILLHESKGAALSWEWFGVVLSLRYHVFAIDMICRGHSDWADMEYGTVDDVDWSGTRVGHGIASIEALVAERALDPVIVIGTGSFGCAGALFGSYHPELTRAMILDDGTMLRADHPSWPLDLDVKSRARDHDGFTHYDSVDEALAGLGRNSTTMNDPRSLDPDWMSRRMDELFVQNADGQWLMRPPRPDDAKPVDLDPERGEIARTTKGKARGLKARVADAEEIKAIRVPTLAFYNTTVSHYSEETAEEIAALNPTYIRLVRVPGEKVPDSMYVSWSARPNWLIAALAFLEDLTDDA
jgi:pimeloyl-ACP methyl ester carboxylesterase